MVDNSRVIDDPPIFGICGWRGSGKTTLIEQIIPQLTGMKLKVAVVKYDRHGVQLDRPGMDSDRLYRVGADVLLQGPQQEFLRVHRTEDLNWMAAIADRYDLILVEGHKATPVRKVWLLEDRQTSPPPGVRDIAAVLSRDSDRPSAVLPILENFLTNQWCKTPIFGCVLIGGRSTRMGRPKHLSQKNGKTWLARTMQLLEQVSPRVVISGAGTIPAELAGCTQLADVVDGQGPISGVLAAMRWAPYASWLVTACDLPDLSVDAVDWILKKRRPGIWAVLPRLTDAKGVEPLLAYYDFRSRALLERQAACRDFRLADIASHPKVISPEVPKDLEPAWRNVNTPEDLKVSIC